MARLASDLTQSECANQIGISQTKLSRLEDGLISFMDSEALNKLAQISGYPVEFFEQPGARMSLGNGFFRRQESIPAKVFKRMEALVNIKRMEISKLIRKVEINHKPRPDWPVEEFADGAREIARHLRNFWAVPNGPVKDLMQIVEDAGCIVVLFDFGTSKIGGLTVYCEDGTPLILLNPDVSYARQRATLSHELGHVVMHRMPTGNMDDEAFDFASEFMMPESEIRSALFPLNLDKLVYLKLKWKVSMQWILKWANKLGAVKDSYYRVLMMKISQNGWRKSEPYDSEWTPEQPELLADIIRHHQVDLGYGAEDFVKWLLPNTRTFSREYLKIPGFSIV